MAPKKRRPVKPRARPEPPDVMMSGFSMHGMTPKRRAAFEQMSERAERLRQKYA